ncbi:MAG: type II toxin-antitoxin system HicB family antitoxin [bacterium]|nr:type II toxin-antitoxin system HicB family antitoxin [bacterium]
MIVYKGYVGVFDFDPETDSFHGNVVNTNDVITFYGSSAAELRREMKRSVKEYLVFCKEQGREPEKPFSGNLMIRTDPELHRRVALEAARRRLSMNAYVQEVLEDAISKG